MQIEVFQCNTEVAMETFGSAKFVHRMKKKMADIRFALSDQIVVEKLEENAKRKQQQQKHVENYTGMVECLANMGN